MVYFMKNMGIIPYLKDKLGFTSDDILKIYQNIVVADPQNMGFETSAQINWDHRTTERAKF